MTVDPANGATRDPSTKIRIGSSLALVGSALGIVAGVVQMTAGDDIASWTGNKASPGALGLLTLALSIIAGVASLRMRRPTNDAGTQLALGALVAVIALVCFSTVGRLWLIPGPLLLIGAGLQVAKWSESVSIVRRTWLRVLLATLGGCELLIAAGATTPALIIGIVGGVALIAAGWLGARNRMATAGLVVLGTLPFALVAWTALVPVLIVLVAGALAISILSVPKHVSTTAASEPVLRVSQSANPQA